MHQELHTERQTRHGEQSRGESRETNTERDRDRGSAENIVCIPVRPCKMACLGPLPVTVTHKSTHVSLAEKSRCGCCFCWSPAAPAALLVIVSDFALHKVSLRGLKAPGGWDRPAAYNAAAAAPPLPPPAAAAWCTPFEPAILASQSLSTYLSLCVSLFLLFFRPTTPSLFFSPEQLHFPGRIRNQTTIPASKYRRRLLMKQT